MAVTQTGTIYKAFSFDNVSSRNYGVYITGEAVYNAPERDVEMISIPGRNGTFALDNGRFENIEVKYPAGIFADNETNFAQAVSDFRNYLCSKKGYFRLTDEYNPDEYRMAVYKSGLEVTPAQLKAGEFEIIFDCMPQRFLLSGEDKITVTDGETLTNPTLFESSPFLEAKGYGNISFNDYEIEIENADFGDVTLLEKQTFYNVNTTELRADASVLIPKKWYNTGDTINVKARIPWKIFMPTSGSAIKSVTVSDTRTDSQTALIKAYPPSIERGMHLYETRSDVEFTAGTYEGKLNGMNTVVTQTDDRPRTIAVQWSIRYEEYDSNSDRIAFTFQGADVENPAIRWAPDTDSRPLCVDKISVNSTKSAYGNPSYIDCDFGLAYRDFYGETISINRFVDLGSDLPKLATGESIVSFDNTITELKIAPRWWKI